MSSEQIRFIEDLRDKHKDNEIWIIGSGKSLDDFSDDFFYDKINITLNTSLLRYQNCSYWHGHHEPYREYVKARRDLLKKSIILYPFPGPFWHGRVLDPIEFFGDLTSVPIWMNFHDTRPVPKDLLEETVRGIMEKKDKVRYHASMSVAHTAIEAAAIMGAKAVSLVGCEHKIFDKGRGRGERCEIAKLSIPYYIDERVVNGTRWLAELFSNYGVDVRRYYNADTEFYDKGYEAIV